MQTEDRLERRRMVDGFKEGWRQREDRHDPSGELVHVFKDCLRQVEDRLKQGEGWSIGGRGRTDVKRNVASRLL